MSHEQPSVEEQAEIQKTRKINNDKLLEGGATSRIDNNGQSHLEPTARQISEAEQEMKNNPKFKELSKYIEDNEVKEGETYLRVTFETSGETGGYFRKFSEDEGLFLSESKQYGSHETRIGLDNIKKIHKWDENNITRRELFVPLS